jgi:hypothetical protein
MSIPLDNPTPLVMQPLLLADRDGAPVLVCLVKGTFRLTARYELLLANEQAPVEPAGKHWGAPESSSYKYEPETALVKPGTDVVLIGHAMAPRGGVTELDVRLRLGTIDKVVRVIGERQWVKRLGIVDMTNPSPFERMSLVWERAFGGWSSSARDPAADRFEPRNPVGVGFRGEPFREGMPLPNLENPRHRLQQYGQTPPPAGFGFTSPHWQPRAAWAGTYDASWQRDRAPLLPLDFDDRFFQGAPSDQIVTPHLRGGEPVEISGVDSSGPVRFTLPAGIQPQCHVRLRSGADQQLATRLDTVIINLDEQLVILLWRTSVRIPNGPHDIRLIALPPGTVGESLRRE